MKMTGGQIICDCLVKEGVDTIYGILGGAILPLYDTLPQFPQLNHILVRHEQCAAHAAEGYARATGKVGVCFATSGPGATNLVTGIANAYLDSTAMVAITGQVARRFIGKDAFQEIDITGITLPITKHNYLVREAGQLAKVIKEAFYIARTGRPGPVLIDVPKDVFTEEVEYHTAGKINLPNVKPNTKGHPAQIEKAAKLINSAEKPLIIAGRGVTLSNANAELKELAEKGQLPVVTTLLGISAFPESHVLSYRWIGMHGMGYANMAVNNADLVVAIGMRFGDRSTAEVNGFASHAKIIHIDIDPAEIGKNVAVDVPIVGDAKSVLAPLSKLIEQKPRGDWLQQLDEYRRDYPSTEIRETSAILPQYVIREIYHATGGDATIVTGVGQQQMWSAQYFNYDKPNTFISSGGLGTMGFGLPASIGGKMGRPDSTVWLIDGDGSFQMTLQELATIQQEGLNIKIAIMNNGFLGMVRQWQELFHGRRYVATPLWGPDFVKLAEAYGIAGTRVRHRDQVIPAIQQAMSHEGAFVIDFGIEPEENVYPMVPPGASLSQFLEIPKEEAASWQQRNTR